jgi:hypothetical protein
MSTISETSPSRANNADTEIANGRHNPSQQSQGLIQPTPSPNSTNFDPVDSGIRVLEQVALSYDLLGGQRRDTHPRSVDGSAMQDSLLDRRDFTPSHVILPNTMSWVKTNDDYEDSTHELFFNGAAFSPSIYWDMNSADPFSPDGLYEFVAEFENETAFVLINYPPAPPLQTSLRFSYTGDEDSLHRPVISLSLSEPADQGMTCFGRVLRLVRLFLNKLSRSFGKLLPSTKKEIYCWVIGLFAGYLIG